MLDFLKCALRNLHRKRFRTILTLSSVAIGVASVVLISSIGAIGKQAVSRELEGLGVGSLIIGVRKQYSSIQLNQQDLDTILADRQVEDAVPVLMEYSTLSMRGLSANAAIWGIGAGSGQILSLALRYGRLLGQGDLAAKENVCLVDTNTALGFYGRENIVGKRVKLTINGKSEEFSVVGVVDSGGNAMQSLVGGYLPMFVYIPYTTLQSITGNTGFQQIAIKVQEEKDAEITAQKVVRDLELSNRAKGAYSVDNVAQQKEQLQRLTDLVTKILSLIAGISLVIAGLGIMTVMLVSVSERTREIGIKKSIGAHPHTILIEFLTEAFVISALGSGWGVLLGMGIAVLGCVALQIQPVFAYDMIGLAVGFAVLLGILSGVYPAWVASRLKPVEALRYEI